MTTRTAVELVSEARALGAMRLRDRAKIERECRDDAATLDAEVTAMRARIAALEAFADEVRDAAHNGDETLAESNATIICALAKLPVKP